MEFWIKTAQLLLSLSILVVLHELGHFIPAKYFKTRVDKFYLFFDAGFSLFKFKKGDTEYGIGWLPLGGYVKIAGMIDESMDTDQLSKEPEPWEFRSKPAWQRLIIMAGGVFVNFVLAIVLYIMVLFVWGEDYIPNKNLPHGMAVHEEFKQFGFRDGDVILSVDNESVQNALEVNKKLFIRDARVLEVRHSDGTEEIIRLPEGTDQMMFQKNAMTIFTPLYESSLDSIFPNTPAHKAGLQKGDDITKIDSKEVVYWNDLHLALKGKENTKVLVTYVRNNTENQVEIVTDSLGHLGVIPESLLTKITIEHKDYSFTQSITGGTSKAFWTLKDYVTQFKFIFTKKGSTAIGGFASIGKIFPATWRWDAFWELTAFLSVMLGFMNLLPIPALDGGHITFLLYEIIAGKAPSEKFLTNAQVVGMVFLLGLMLYANGLDIFRMFE